jgi:hypothetical protein
MLFVVYYLLYVICYLLYVICCMLFVVCVCMQKNMGHKMLASTWCVLDRNLGSELNEHMGVHRLVRCL